MASSSSCSPKSPLQRSLAVFWMKRQLSLLIFQRLFDSFGDSRPTSFIVRSFVALWLNLHWKPAWNRTRVPDHPGNTVFRCWTVESSASRASSWVSGIGLGALGPRTAYSPPWRIFDTPVGFLLLSPVVVAARHPLLGVSIRA